jgi:uncharacterized protein (TIRG00374 family)
MKIFQTKKCVMREMSELRWTVLGVVIGITFLYVSMHGTDIHSILNTLKMVELLPVTLAAVAGILFMLIKAWRWSVILRPVTHADFRLLHSAVYIGTAANLIIVHSGELLRATMVGRRSRVASSAILASVGVERVFDFMVVVTLFGVLLIFDQRLPDYVAAAGFIAIVMVMVGLLVILSLFMPSRFRSRLVGLVAFILPSPLAEALSRQLKRGLVGFSVLVSPLALVKIFTLSVLMWSCIVGSIWLSAVSVGYAVTVPMAITVWVLMVVGLTLPSSPAQLGTTQLAFTLGLSGALVESDVPFAASVVYLCCVNIPYMIIGAGCWIQSRLAVIRPKSLYQEIS